MGVRVEVGDGESLTDAFRRFQQARYTHLSEWRRRQHCVTRGEDRRARARLAALRRRHAAAWSEGPDALPRWLTDDAVCLAAKMRESGDFSPMPTLGDQLRAAGCRDEQLLDHCRSPDSHVGSCWVLTLVLGK